MLFKRGEVVEVVTPTIVVVETQTEGVSLWHKQGTVLETKRFPTPQAYVDFDVLGKHWLFANTISSIE